MSNQPTASNSPRSMSMGPLLVFGGLAAIAIGALVFFLLIDSGKKKPSPTEGPTGSSPETAVTEPASQEDGYAQAQKLAGRWLREDGGYILDIQSVAEDGTMKAAYLNPRPIDVPIATWKLEGGRTQLFFELRGQGYPGCTYTLHPSEKGEMLTGNYYQAAQRQNYPVVFVRAPK